MRPFDPLLAVLEQIAAPHRAEGKLYKLPYVLLLSSLAVVTARPASSTRSLERLLYRKVNPSG